ncbi:MAG TPA: fused MFS/spermidine synthase [Candidatus Margulisiibacteriota bacterium]|nr:fused MFS/spermidine synthase [Candidatus Margulisiibacteriota bacterium]
MPPAVLFTLFFASGACGLIYEVVWIRLLTLTLSVTVYALTTVLCAFMAGLALGSWLAGRWADRLQRPLLAFGAAEFGVGTTGVLTLVALFNLGPAYVWLHNQLGGAGPAFTLARFSLAFAVLLVPCTLMGTTLPMLSRAAVAHSGVVGRRAGGLYAVNTLGAVLGCLAAGFGLIPNMGLYATSLTAAVVNVSVGLLAMGLGRRATSARSIPQATKGSLRASMPPRVQLVCLAFALSGFTAMGYEVLWTRALEQFTHNSTYAYTAILATFLLGLGAGSALAAAVADRLLQPLRMLGLIEAGIGISVVAALILYPLLVVLVPAAAAAVGGLTSWWRVIVLIFAQAAVVLLPMTLLFGATFPFVARAVVHSVDSVGQRIAAAAVANTVGSILGALLVGFVILPTLGMRGSFMLLVLLNCVVAAVLLLASDRRQVVPVVAGLMAVVAFAVVIVPPQLFERTFAERFGRLLFYREEVTDTVMVTEDTKGERLIRYGDGRGTAGTATMREDRMYAHIPLLLHPDPRRILNICFGVGNTLASVTTYPIERVDCVELSPGVVHAAPFFVATNRDVLADPRVRLTIQDGRNFLLTSCDRYDVIRLDPPELHTAGVVNLYTREFYELARDHLAPGGIFSIWVNGVMTPEPEMRMIVRTIASVFPYVTVWDSPYRYSWVINGSIEPRPPDLALILKHFADPHVQADLASIGVDDPFAFLRYFMLGGRDLERFAEQGPLVTDNRTYLDFTVPRSLDAFFGIANSNTNYSLVSLMEPGEAHDVAASVFLRKVARMQTFRQSVLPYLTNIDAAGFDREAVQKRLEAVGDPVQGSAGRQLSPSRDGG